MSEPQNEETVGEQQELTVAIPEDRFRCAPCPGRTPRASYEDGEWVCYGCGSTLPDDVAKVADQRVSEGKGEYDYTRKLGEAIGDAASEVAEGVADAE